MIKEIEVGGIRYSIQAENTIKTTWAELKALRDEAKLNAGTFYRITDYVTTTTQSDTKSANHPFDIIVLALSENTLSEDAKAILHEGDTYFADGDLSAWELKYCLDNDKTKFEWADETNGKGVIYRMVDEKQNDCPYDFKNILFYNTKLTSNTTSDKYYYTFSYVVNGVLYDGTTEKQVKNCYSNVMGEYRGLGVLRLNKNVFINNRFDDTCFSNTFRDNCYSNTFRESCSYNTLGEECKYNIFGPVCSSNKFGCLCKYNTFGTNCSSNTFEGGCSSNTFGNRCYYNTFGLDCGHNTLGEECKYRNLEGGSYKTVINLHEEFYDDGSGQVVPVKHPDLSTQPSTLPYKFMGQYVYEQLIPTSELIINGNGDALIPTSLIGGDFILDCCAIGTYGVAGITLTTSGTGWILSNDRVLGRGFKHFNYIKIVYTSMPEDSSYYGYNNY